MEDLETEILDTFGYLFEEGDGDGDGNGDGNGDWKGMETGGEWLLCGCAIVLMYL